MHTQTCRHINPPVSPPHAVTIFVSMFVRCVLVARVNCRVRIVNSFCLRTIRSNSHFSSSGCPRKITLARYTQSSALGRRDSDSSGTVCCFPPQINFKHDTVISHKAVCTSFLHHTGQSWSWKWVLSVWGYLCMSQRGGMSVCRRLFFWVVLFLYQWGQIFQNRKPNYSRCLYNPYGFSISLQALRVCGKVHDGLGVFWAAGERPSRYLILHSENAHTSNGKVWTVIVYRTFSFFFRYFYVDENVSGNYFKRNFLE